jgi:hypothetical protein
MVGEVRPLAKSGINAVTLPCRTRWLVPHGYRELTSTSIAKVVAFVDLPTEVSSAFLDLESELAA